MSYFKPTKYYKNIYSIDYNKLKKLGIKCLVFDLDNPNCLTTLAMLGSAAFGE